ncbi:RNA polymerase sigma factor SigY [Paenibacillus apiarius]|uniref:RNA polymerase sigma factor n=1 Tax=Paenibacillus apiarius TaxID=46240 RepID=A0ABT4DXA6_9BACL|nr:RNA polymerase sigma factor SigY [Paenibacillus apiarius]MCY9512956.1 RNA polymerase sigma factor SigY [Paenibacillus apiarius]MCY9521995.1 RNA polymerase sigma factor SigY [Paenibacillus apiarius]MCY9555040.1 RNA polymerase sigma factor SigY [Paenibacillus apiarius]MCY9558060.1 RNA polymerase sigma factor SigY [Paenibacillus apiarius]MCY9686732.1 RNA polymerase sigma factor SigY [Paenibacillus apiarius]
MTEQDTIDRAQAGDTAALALLLQKHYTFVRNYVLKLTMNPILTDDIVQDTMLKSMEKLHLYNGASKFSSWLITIATRIYVDLTRRQKVEKRWQEQATRSLRYQMEAHNEEWTDMIDSLGKLPPEQRAAILLKHYYGYTYPEIAEMLNCSEGTAKSRVFYGIEHIRKELR